MVSNVSLAVIYNLMCFLSPLCQKHLLADFKRWSGGVEKERKHKSLRETSRDREKGHAERLKGSLREGEGEEGFESFPTLCSAL